MIPGRKDAGAQARDEEVEEVEHLLRRPPVLRHAQLDADLRDSSVSVSRSRQSLIVRGCRLARMLAASHQSVSMQAGHDARNQNAIGTVKKLGAAPICCWSCTCLQRGRISYSAYQLDESDQGDQPVAGRETVLAILPPFGVRVNAFPPVGQGVDGFLQDGPHCSVSRAARRWRRCKEGMHPDTCRAAWRVTRCGGERAGGGGV